MASLVTAERPLYALGENARVLGAGADGDVDAARARALARACAEDAARAALAAGIRAAACRSTSASPTAAARRRRSAAVGPESAPPPERARAAPGSPASPGDRRRSSNTATTANNHRRSPSPVSKHRLRARKFGEKHRRWEKFNQQNAREAERLQAELASREAAEAAARGRNAAARRPPNPYKQYFGFDCRKAYPYPKMRAQIGQVERLAAVEDEIESMMREANAAYDELQNSHFFPDPPPKTQAQNKTKTRRAAAKPDVFSSMQLTNIKSSKLLFAGTMDTRTFEAEWRQAWHQSEEGLSIWDATRLGDVPRVRELLERSARYRRRKARRRRKMLPPPAYERDFLNARGVDGQTPLHYVVMLRDNALHDEVFDLLMEHGADVAAQTIEGYTPLHYCLASPLPNMDLMDRMLAVADDQWRARMAGTPDDTGADCASLGALAALVSEDGATVADMKTRTTTTTTTTNANANANANANSREEAAKRWRCLKCNATNPQGARVCGACGVVPARWYLDHERQRRPIDMKTVFGETVTSMSIKAGLRDRLMRLLPHKPDLNRPDELGYTMLMRAVNNNRLDLIQLLLAHGADATICNYHGESARTFAEDRALQNDDDILMYLRNAAGDEGGYAKARMWWHMPPLEWELSALAQATAEREQRRTGTGGSRVKLAAGARSRRRREGAPRKFDIDYGEWFGRDLDREAAAGPGTRTGHGGGSGPAEGGEEQEGKGKPEPETTWRATQQKTQTQKRPPLPWTRGIQEAEEDDGRPPGLPFLW